MLTMYQDNALTGPAHLAWPRTYTGPHTADLILPPEEPYLRCNLTCVAM